jgi:hypothetical protein
VRKSVSVQEENAISLESVDNASKTILGQNVINVNAKMEELVKAINVCARKTSMGYCVKLGLRNAQMVYTIIIPKIVFVLKFIEEYFVKHTSARIMEHVTQMAAIVLPY